MIGLRFVQSGRRKQALECYVTGPKQKHRRRSSTQANDQEAIRSKKNIRSWRKEQYASKKVIRKLPEGSYSINCTHQKKTRVTGWKRGVGERGGRGGEVGVARSEDMRWVGCCEGRGAKPT